MKTNQLPKLSDKGKTMIQTLIGANIGLTFSGETFTMFKEIWLAAIIIPLLHILSALFLAFLLHRLLKFGIITAPLSTTPAGLSEMSILADKYHTSIPMVVTIHLFRVLIIVSFLPLIIFYFIK